ncbi:MAG: aminotransferase class I/II-fold pyridoxal phosphate-dependent enzyme, partial [Propionibacteriaceae bacterium]|nr:aminotransferase class I/II-fold pyridoxal phosphate-dependent enzyme [Propionibacteriaceae bacterium]
VIAAYTQGGPWLDSMRNYVWRNKHRLSEYAEAHLPQLHVIPSQATYLSWIDCSEIAEDARSFTRFLRQETGLIVNPGDIYGANTKSFFRINLACPAIQLEDGLRRLTTGVRSWTMSE